MAHRRVPTTGGDLGQHRVGVASLFAMSGRKLAEAGAKSGSRGEFIEAERDARAQR